jgi:hypothetical protein
MCNTLRHYCADAARAARPIVASIVAARSAAAGALMGAALIGAAACSDGTDAVSLANQNAGSDPPLSGMSPAAPAGPGSPGTGSPGTGATDVPGGSGALPASSGSNAASGSPPAPGPAQGETPASVPSPSEGEPEPNATETNFFGAGCRKDADCGANRRCELPDPGAAPPAEPDAGAESADASPPLVPVGRCVAL